MNRQTLVVYSIFYSNFHIFKINFVSFNFILKLSKLSNIFFILGKNKYRFVWSESFNVGEKETQLNYIFLKNNSNNTKVLKKNNDRINNIILLKKKTSLIKKNNDFDYFLVNKINENKNLFYFNYNKNYSENKTIYLGRSKDYNKNYKSFDLKYKTKAVFKSNRLILKKLYDLKYYRKFSLSKNLKKLSNFKKKDFLFNLENKLINILMLSDFFFSSDDCLWFIKNGLISVNFLVIKNKNFIVKFYDIINIINSNYYYKFYKSVFNDLLLNIYKINLKLWSINKNKYKNLDNKNYKQNYPKWLEFYKFFKKDVPLKLEVDYISMTIIFLNYNFNVKDLNYFNFKFLNLYLNRLYNWKFII